MFVCSSVCLFVCRSVYLSVCKSTLRLFLTPTSCNILLLPSLLRCLTWAEGNIVEEMLADVCDPNTGRCYGNVVKVRNFLLSSVSYLLTSVTPNFCNDVIVVGIVVNIRVKREANNQEFFMIKRKQTVSIICMTSIFTFFRDGVPIIWVRVVLSHGVQHR